LWQVVIVRKKIKRVESGEVDRPQAVERAATEARQEERILSLLRSLKHPNIIKLFASYTHRQEHYLLFPPAEMTLAEALDGDRLSEFEDCNLYRAICGLSSAIKHVHLFFSKEFDLQLIGCHHDLKPKNILILRGKLLLADFGLSTLREGNNSQSDFKTGDLDYLAPECHYFGAEFVVRNGKTSRKSDIWSFGAVLSEIMTYTRGGCEAVREFRRKRVKVLYDALEVCQFHHGGEQCAVVSDWLRDFDAEASSTRLLLLGVVRDALSIEPSQRPLAAEMTTRLYHLAQASICSSCHGLFDQFVKFELPLVLKIEHQRFKLWCQFSQPTDTGEIPLWFAELPERQLVRLNELLLKIREELKSISSAVENPILSPIYAELRSLLDELWSSVPSAIFQEMRRHLVTQLLETDQNSLQSIHQDLRGDLIYDDIGVLAAMKFLTHNMPLTTQSEDTLSRLHLDDANIIHSEEFGPHTFAELRSCNGSITTRILIERIKYNGAWVEDGHGQELLERIAAIACLLRNSQLISGLQVLECLGFFHDLESLSVALVYRLPNVKVSPQSPGIQVRPINLRDYIRSTYDRKSSRPFLGAIFRLAHILANGILEYHTVSWLHKDISSFNIIFFPVDSSAEAMQSAFDMPHIIGFNHSRQSKETAFTQGPFISPESRHYVAPEYLSHRAPRYQWRYDYYSVGMVLLELGLWRCVSDWTTDSKWRKLGLSPQALRDKILQELVPRLGNAMGRAYYEAVTACLSGNFVENGTDFENVSSLFQKRVVGPLSTVLVV
jgi:serine/threonine protein kinase